VPIGKLIVRLLPNMRTRRPFPVEFAVTPRFDVFYALYTLTANGPSTLETWKTRANARLPRDFARAATRVAPLPIFWPLFADGLQGKPGEMTFDEIVSSIRQMPANDLKTSILSGIFHDSATVRSLVSGKNSFRQILSADNPQGAELLVHFGLRPYDPASPSAKALSELVSNPESFGEELALFLERFWQSGFGRDWKALEGELSAESFRMRDLDEELSLEELTRDLGLPVAFDDKEKVVRPNYGPPIPYDQVDHCWIIPCAFNIRRWWAKYEAKSGSVCFYFPTMQDPSAANRIGVDDRGAREATQPSRKIINAETVFKALGDTTRYAIASILARAPTTSADLARSLKVSKPTITHHIQALRSAGLISETPARGSTKLSLDRETLGAVSAAAVDQLFSSTGDLSLVTTRKRRS
jgi:DNA-binding transcriptional ArsR family regulator